MSGSRRRFLKALGYNALVTSEFLKTGVPAFSLPGQERPGTTQATETITLDPDRITVLMGSDAALLGSLKVRWPGERPKRFWVENWRTPDDAFVWTIHSPQAAEYSASLVAVSCPKAVVNCAEPSSPVKLELTAGTSRLTHWLEYRNTSPEGQWMREKVQGVLQLPAGASQITLRAAQKPAKGAMNLALYSLELAKPETRTILAKKAEGLRSSPQWMADAQYGLMFTWTTRTQPRQGKAKPYCQAVKDFDVQAFADMVAETGAGFIVFVTTWADHYFPAPIKAIDRILPGRTCDRDLLMDLADALERRGIKLVVYYHCGHGDKQWWARTGFEKADKTEFFANWCAIVSEIGQRYGKKMAGFWFDDGFAVYYPVTAPWEQMTRAAKIDNPDRLVAYNSWIWPKATDFQDYFCGESEDLTEGRITGEGFLPVGGSGIFTGGPQSGLQGNLCARNEPGDWCHTIADSEIPAPLHSAEYMIEKFKQCIARRNVPVINLQVYQDGTASPAALAEFAAIRQAIKGG